jgi:hypothetical protein
VYFVAGGKCEEKNEENNAILKNLEKLWGV